MNMLDQPTTPLSKRTLASFELVVENFTDEAAQLVADSQECSRLTKRMREPEYISGKRAIHILDLKRIDSEKLKRLEEVLLSVQKNVTETLELLAVARDFADDALEDYERVIRTRTSSGA